MPENGLEWTELHLPNWLPGSYKIRDFARNILEFAAFQADAPCPWEKLDKHRWRVRNRGLGFGLVYLVYAFDLSVRGAHLDDSHGFFNGSSLFLQPWPDDGRGYEVDLIPPRDNLAASAEREDETPLEPRGTRDSGLGTRKVPWQLLTGLPALHTDAQGFGRYAADSYSQLIDHPVEMGQPEVCLFSVQGVPHRLAVSGRHFADLKAISQALRAICTCHVELFGELPVEDQYLFLLQLVGQGYGGLEHRNSTSLICARSDLEKPDPAKLSDKYRQFLALCSHEYFHLWNGKRICPQAYLQPDLSREVHSQLLWLVEGVTSYYDELALVRAGVIPLSDYLDMLAKNLTRYFRGKGRQRQSLAESSFDAWTKFYQQDENAANAIVSYYVKGGIVVMLIDLSLRRLSDGEYSFDDVMRHLWHNFGKTGIGVAEQAMAGIIEQASGIDLAEELHRWTQTTAPLEQDLADLLADVGVGFALRPPRQQQDPGGLRPVGSGSPDSTDASGPPWLGIGFKPHPQGVEVLLVHEDSPAAEAGLAAGDLLLAIDGLRLDAANLDQQLSRLVTDQASVPLHLFRGDQLLQRSLPLRPGSPQCAELWLLADADTHTQQQERRRAWLHQN
ncbi:M61 family metallopeptidase [Magnetovirga frankeli]|uniref:M61 family metallopeptidase n=1 Tax=Magnetovirga frankeli TaxID=947516 RepID=UPI001293793C|nr:M61 family metallopeptidase [gamma proteobacterium SS-5]